MPANGEAMLFCIGAEIFLHKGDSIKTAWHTGERLLWHL